MTELLQIGPSPIQGLGGFAKSFIPAGGRVIEYMGERITKAESARRCEAMNWFIFGLDDEFDLDGNVEWNPARFLNHSCAPNCEAENPSGRIFILARRRIRAGEELTYHYGKEYFNKFIKPKGCKCTKCAQA